MEKREIIILFAVVLGVFVIGGLGNLTGHSVNESLVSCNVADFNGDGVVNYVDKEDFGESYGLINVNGDPKGLLDFNSDGVVTIQDANRYNELYDDNYGVRTGSCYLRGEEPKLKSPIPSEIGVGQIGQEEQDEQAEMTQQKPYIINAIGDFFKAWFKK